MKKHLLCLTIDTDPDGLSGQTTNRRVLQWDGLDQLQALPEELDSVAGLGRVPITWFIRADGQLESILGASTYLLERYGKFWKTLQDSGDELGWHPHLYRQQRPADETELITDPREACDELERLWNKLKTNFRATSFRNGEGWHVPETYFTVEQLGFLCDSTVIPGRTGGSGHPMSWEGSPNHPYFPCTNDLRSSGPPRLMIELPMNTWRLQAPYDPSPRLRYINPTVHPHLFAKALQNWENECAASPADLSIWVMIFHPDEVLATQGNDNLYSRSTRALAENLVSMKQSLHRIGHDFEWVTVSAAAEHWRGHTLRQIA